MKTNKNYKRFELPNININYNEINWGWMIKIKLI